MKSGRYKYLLFAFLQTLVIASCKVAYNPPEITAITNYLVVEGVINTGADSTYIKLSRTLSLNSSTNLKTELKAKVTIFNSKGISYTLTELGKGSYACAPLNISNTDQYQLQVKTSDGKTYLSDLVQAKAAPPIDSITWKAANDGLEIFASAHDAANNTRYYRWDYTEAWEFRSTYDSFYISDGVNINVRTLQQHIWDCFSNDISTNIVLGSSVKLTQGIIDKQTIAIVPQTDERIGYKYSIQVKQYALTAEAYDYWTQLKKNTEQLGSIFDAQPSASIGNIHCITNPTEPVIGFISAGTTSISPHIFITKTQLPNWRTTPFYPECQLELDSAEWHGRFKTPPKADIDIFINFNSGIFQGKDTQLIPVSQYGPTNYMANYMAAPIKCVDCTLRGSLTPPPFWK